MKKVMAILTALVSVLTLCFTVACNGENDRKDNAEINNYNSPLLAHPVSVSESNSIKVLDSITDNTYNYYLIDVGYIESMYITTLAMVDYTGVPISFTKTTSSSSSIVSSLTEGVSNSITVSDSQSHSVSISLGWRDIFPIGEFSVSAGYTWNGTWSNSETTSKSTTSTVSSASDYAESQTFSYEFGENSALLGKYRYALYSTCDIYFIVQTTADNKQLVLWETQVCARQEEYFIRSEYSENGKFEICSDGEINIKENFYKTLPLPEEIAENENNSTNVIDYSQTVRTGTTTIYNGNNNVKDVVYFGFPYTYDQLRLKGCTKLTITLWVDIKEYRTSSDLYNGISIEDKEGTAVKTWEYKRHTGDWETYMIQVQDLDINRFYMGDNSFKLRLKYYCKNSNFQDWYLGTVKVRITIY